jgi:aspartate dehydrogenase
MATRLAIIGYGAITDEIVRVLGERGLLASVSAILVRPARLEEARRKAGGRFAVVGTLDELLRGKPGMVAECAGHGAMRDYASTILQARVPLLCSSVGVLADSGFASALMQTAGAGGLLIPSGAIAGIDGLLAARTAGLKAARYTSIKPPPAWIGTPAEKLIDDRRKVLFEGTAREAALAYPKNVNVGITVALAGLGMDETRVSLVSDPAASGPLGIIEASGDFGTFRFEILAFASPHNPKTSLLTAHSIVAAAFSGVSFPAAPALRGGATA